MTLKSGGIDPRPRRKRENGAAGARAAFSLCGGQPSSGLMSSFSHDSYRGGPPPQPSMGPGCAAEGVAYALEILARTNGDAERCEEAGVNGSPARGRCPEPPEDDSISNGSAGISVSPRRPRALLTLRVADTTMGCQVHDSSFSGTGGEHHALLKGGPLFSNFWNTVGRITTISAWFIPPYHAWVP